MNSKTCGSEENSSGSSAGCTLSDKNAKLEFGKLKCNQEISSKNIVAEKLGQMSYS